jgi:hypothetical protein
LNNGDGVSGEQRATLAAASGPVQHGGAVEVPADAGQGKAGTRLLRVALSPGSCVVRHGLAGSF